MKKTFLLIIFSAITAVVTAQRPNIDSLKQRLQIEKTDTGRLRLYASINTHYNFANADSALIYANRALQAVKPLGIPLLEATFNGNLSYSLYLTGNYIASMQAALSGLSIAEEQSSSRTVIPFKYRNLLGDKSIDSLSDENTHLYVVARLHYLVGFVYIATDQPKKAIEQLLISKQIFQSINNQRWLHFTLTGLSRVYASTHNYKSGLEYGLAAYQLSEKLGLNKHYTECYIGDNYVGLNDTISAKKWFYKAIGSGEDEHSDRGLANVGLSQIFLTSGKLDSALWHARRALHLAESQKLKKLALAADTLLAVVHEAVGNTDSAYFYLQRSVKRRNELFNSEKAQELLSIVDADRQHKADIAAAKAAYKRKMQVYSFIAALFFLLCVALFLWRNNRQRSKANKTLSRQKHELEKALQKLGAAQSQLIQSEKMASLGELTAGIAHEIQNPLNFINNFSEVSKELAEEIQTELDNGNIADARLLADDISSNSDKIVHHGKRADSIVKNMLAHSRQNSAQKELTDINALVDEYLRLSYHGLRAKDNSFNALMETHYDPALQMNVNPQDIGRVLLNLFNNAFYAVNEKKKTASPPSKGGISHEEYEPTVIVTTSLNLPSGGSGAGVVISVKDNGNGIPQKIVDKIYQPFFTTKPTGEGTGLGLSLSYDIIKAHGGEMKVETKEEDGAEFIIKLPV